MTEGTSEETRHRVRPDRARLDGVFYEMRPNDLFRLRSALGTLENPTSAEDLAAAVDPVSPPLATWVRAQAAEPPAVAGALSAIVGVLLTIWMISEEPATPSRLDDVIDKAITGRLHEMPIPRRIACFCGSGKKYKSCHGRG